LIALLANYVTVVEDRPIMSAEHRLSVTFDQNSPTQQSHRLFATVQILVYNIPYKTRAIVMKFGR